MTEEPRQTSGTASRPARDLEDALMRFDLAEELRRLGEEPAGNDPQRSTITLAAAGRLRITLVNLGRGTDLGGRDNDESIAIQVLRGAVTVSRGDRAERLEPEQLAVIEGGGPWRAVAETDAVVLLTAAGS